MYYVHLMMFGLAHSTSHRLWRYLSGSNVVNENGYHVNHARSIPIHCIRACVGCELMHTLTMYIRASSK